MFLSNLLPLSIVLNLQSAVDIEKRSIIISSNIKDYYFPFCATKPWNIIHVDVLEQGDVIGKGGNSSMKEGLWFLNITMTKKGSTTPSKYIQLLQSEIKNVSLCDGGDDMIVLKVDIDFKETHQQASRVKREVNMKQSWTSDKFYQIIKDSDGIEFTVKVTKHPPVVSNEEGNVPAPVNISATITPIFTPASTTASTVSSSTTIVMDNDDDDDEPLSDECRKYKTSLDSMVDWAFIELDRIKTSDSPLCSLRIVNKERNT